jgi:hypothetical protein
MNKLRLSKQTVRILSSQQLTQARGASDDTSINSGYTVCLTRMLTLCTVISARCQTP